MARRRSRKKLLETMDPEFKDKLLGETDPSKRRSMTKDYYKPKWSDPGDPNVPRVGLAGSFGKSKGGKGWAKAFAQMKARHGIYQSSMTMVPRGQTGGSLSGKIGTGKIIQPQTLHSQKLVYWDKTREKWKVAPDMLQPQWLLARYGQHPQQKARAAEMRRRYKGGYPGAGKR